MNSDNTMYALLEEAKQKAMKEAMEKGKNNSVIIDENKIKQK
jgi:hypothetical protein